MISHISPAFERHDFHADDDHREVAFVDLQRGAEAIIRPAVGAIELYCQDSMPWSGASSQYPCYVWKHYE